MFCPLCDGRHQVTECPVYKSHVDLEDGYFFPAGKDMEEIQELMF